MHFLPVFDTNYVIKWSAIALEAKTAWKIALQNRALFKIINIFHHSIFCKEKYTNLVIQLQPMFF